jgi:tRNA pseudouridine55 synthase
VLVVDKPIGRRRSTSSGACGARRAKRVGHGGTLDPAASGVLPICLGEATKLAQFLLDADKEYAFTVCFGVETDTDDAAGDVTARATPPRSSRRPCGARWRVPRPIAQVPPELLGAEARGRPLYDYARAGEAVDVRRAHVVVHELELTSFAGPDARRIHDALLEGHLRARAGPRSRAGAGRGRHVTALRRTRSGRSRWSRRAPLDEVLARAGGRRLGAAAGPPAAALRHLDQRVVHDQVAATSGSAGASSWKLAKVKSADRDLPAGRPGKLVAWPQPRRIARLNCCAFSVVTR